MPNKRDLKEFGNLLSRDERFIWNKLNAGYKPKEIVEMFGMSKRTYQRRWEEILNKGRRFFK